MDSKTTKQIKSGTTTPGSKNAPTMSTDWFAQRRIREDDEQTMVTSIDDESAPSVALPNVPLNSPEASYAPSLDSDFDNKVRALADEFGEVSTHVESPPTSSSGAEKGDLAEAHAKATAISKNLLKYAQSIESIGEETVRDPKQGVMEYNQWANYAEEDVTHGFQRLARLARDLHQKDKSKTAEQYFSDYLTKLIKAAELEFDPSGLL